ncbi:hypothetical protein BB462_00335 [Helicobacter pylori]|nr:hypothetical protein [Helicobacter pylori]PDX35052.1 hypothetical protein BB462_00335 [Helicobacter pylori]
MLDKIVLCCGRYGSGKSTLANLLFNSLNDRGYNCYKLSFATILKQMLGGLLKADFVNNADLKNESVIAKPHENKHAKDFNFEAHQKNDTKPELEDFKRTIADYLSYEVGLILKNQTPPK